MNQKMEQIKKNFEAMVEFSQHNQIKPILATELTIRAKDGWTEKLRRVFGSLRGKASYQAYVNAYVGNINQWLKKYTQANCLLLLDFNEILSNEEGIRRKEYTAPDGNHISGAGYDQLTEYSRNILQFKEIYKAQS